MDIIWDVAPIRSGKLAELVNEKLGWAKSTTYTRLRILEEKGYIENCRMVVSVKISRQEAQTYESGLVVKESFNGSLPGFLTAFLDGRGISPEEAAELESLIEKYKGGSV